MKTNPCVEGEDVGTFINLFEQNMELAEEDWNAHLTGVLGGQIREACKEINLTRIAYPDVRQTILRYCKVTPESQRIKFREMKWDKKENPERHVQQMEARLKGWMVDRGIREEVLNAVILEGILGNMPKEANHCINERDPKDKTDLVKYMHNYMSFHPEMERSQQRREQTKPNPISISWKEKKPFGERKTFTRETRPAPTKQDMEGITGFKCQKKGHYARNCRQEKMH